MPTPSLQDCVRFIEASDVLPEWTNIQLCEAVNKAIKDCSLTYTIDESGRINSICLGKWNSDGSLHITAMVGKGKIKPFLAYLKTIYPNVKYLTFYRSKRNLQLKHLTLK